MRGIGELWGVWLRRKGVDLTKFVRLLSVHGFGFEDNCLSVLLSRYR